MPEFDGLLLPQGRIDDIDPELSFVHWREFFEVEEGVKMFVNTNDDHFIH